jgi:hypothetical protein
MRSAFLRFFVPGERHEGGRFGPNEDLEERTSAAREDWPPASRE